MCTVSFIPAADRVYLASNRDEKHFRSNAIPPTAYPSDNGQILYPRDGDAGGTWIAQHENGHAIVFLNGGFHAHEPCPPYRKSRGKVLLDFIESSSPVETGTLIDLDNIEPFTAVIWSEGMLHEFRWDGARRHLRKMNASKPHIWSSVTLYDNDVISRREAWFEDWINRHPSPGLEDILYFHQFTGDGDAHNDLMMNRHGQVFTVSITGLEIRTDKALMKYIDLKNQLQYDQEISLRTLYTQQG
ncbi:MAG: NRDE family protein [Chitinophagaceae bacterium]|jgi:hypothetical protein|nr:NRDE family protein [Chitinophagaceae bacterium]